MSSSCSFRITRTAEDLAQTINALSQRLVKLEERQQFLESRLENISQDLPTEEIEMLDGVEELLRECKSLLDISCTTEDSKENWGESDIEDVIAA